MFTAIGTPGPAAREFLAGLPPYLVLNLGGRTFLVAHGSPGNDMDYVTRRTHPPAVRNNAGGHWNHSFFWNLMAPEDQRGEPTAELIQALETAFGSVEDFRTAGKEASVAFAISKYMTGYQWLANFVTVAILAGFSSVILVMLLGQSRVFYTMSLDGLVPKIFSDLHPKFKTPYKSNMLFFILTALFGGFVPGNIVGEMTSIGTLFAFILVCAGVWIMRVRRPDLKRAFVTPMVPVVSTLGIITCGAMIFGLGPANWLRLVVWLALGLVFYFAYGKSHSILNRPGAT